jgi:hypothetical protein
VQAEPITSLQEDMEQKREQGDAEVDAFGRAWDPDPVVQNAQSGEELELSFCARSFARS